MAFFLRQLPDGTKFMLCRTRQKFLFVRREMVKGHLRYIVQKEGETLERWLHHSCFVKPVVRATLT